MKQQNALSEMLFLRVTAEEKAAFREIATVRGTSLSDWMRERLRTAAAEELQETGRPRPAPASGSTVSRELGIGELKTT